MPKFSRAMTHFFLFFFLKVGVGGLDTLLTRLKCLSFQRAITKENNFRKFSKVNQVIYLLALSPCDVSEQ